MTNRQSFFVALEGIDNVGKTSLLGFLSSEFSNDLPVVTTKELTTPVGSFIREQLAMGGLDSVEKALLFAADRQTRLRSGFAASLRSRALCVADRWTLSAAAYRSAEDPELLDYVLQINSVFPIPDLVIVIDIPAELSIARGAPINKNSYSLEYLSTVREQYISLATRFSYTIIDGTRDLNSIGTVISQMIRQALHTRALTRA